MGCIIEPWVYQSQTAFNGSGLEPMLNMISLSDNKALRSRQVARLYRCAPRRICASAMPWALGRWVFSGVFWPLAAAEVGNSW